MTRWLILADDLTGAADCAVAFARRGHAAAVSWAAEAAGEAPVPETPVLAVDADSRRLPPEAAAARHRALVAARHAPGTALLKKIDSTLRGQPAAELAATLDALRAAGGTAPLAIVAPAFPATGRTTEGGAVRLDGAPLEDSALWARDHSYPTAHLPTLLAAAGLAAAHLPLDALRGGGTAAAVRDALAAGRAALVCDAATEGDLLALAHATLPLAGRVVWVGAGGLADALAAASPGGAAEPPRPVASGGGVLLVVGSVAEASRAAAATLLARGGVRPFAVPPALLRDGGGPAWDALAAAIAAALRDGQDVLVSIEADGAADLSRGAALAEGLAALLQPAGRAMGALFATGGETARALLGRLGVHGLRLVEEVEPGMPLALTQGARAVPAITKAGGFGTSDTIARAHARLRALLDERE